ncbi:MAG: class I SAM-dependent methyltransferase [Rhodocyclaceae bacterium]|nr:class I SAM-dependent methyltransferase [Rhodocyclaceae bacterium]MBP6108442.1 class I SAM-dependent methyltransferase [Rhodocyclaceae bacterium]MBP6278263.1 class I SAM-dependent methyltransferase [Rhodocyclaceae bacterium]
MVYQGRTCAIAAISGLEASAVINDSVSPAPTGDFEPLHATITWVEGDAPHTARWRSENGVAAPTRTVIAGDKTTADIAYRLACEGTALLWRGDFQNARQLMLAMARRIDKQAARRTDELSTLTPKEIFHRGRQQQARRARLLGMLLLQFEPGHHLSLRRAPDVRDACTEAFGDAPEAYVMSLRELLGAIGAHEWRKNGVQVAALGEKIHPHYGVFAPIRNEYLDLIANAPLSSKTLAFDIGTGTGVLAAILARRGVARVVATDLDARATACAQENIERLGIKEQVSLLQTDLFPPYRAPLIVCNPPWLPAPPSSRLEQAVYDPDSRMLRGFLSGLAAHLEADGEGWLILSDLAEHLGLRSRDQLLAWIAGGGLQVIGRIDIAPKHPRTRDATDPLHAARAAEITSLWRLGRS